MVVLFPLMELALVVGLTVGTMAVVAATLAPPGFGLIWLAVLLLPVALFLLLTPTVAVTGGMGVTMTLVGAAPLFAWAGTVVPEGPHGWVGWAYWATPAVLLLAWPVVEWLQETSGASTEEFRERMREARRLVEEERWPEAYDAFRRLDTEASNRHTRLQLVRCAVGLGRRHEAEAVLRQMEDPMARARAFAILGDAGRAVEALERSAEENPAYAARWMRAHEEFSGLRTDPRFVRLLERTESYAPDSVSGGE